MRNDLDESLRSFSLRRCFRPSWRMAGAVALLFLAIFAVGWVLDETGLMPRSIDGHDEPGPGFWAHILFR